MKLQYTLSLLIPRTNALIEPESTFGTSLIESVNATTSNYETAFYSGEEIAIESQNLFQHLDLRSATFDARSGKVANLDLSEALLPGAANSLLWSVGIDSPTHYDGKPRDDSEWKYVATNAVQEWITSYQSELNIDANELFVSTKEDDEMAVRSAVHNDGDMIQFSLQRSYKGVVVRGSRASVTIKAGNLANIGFEMWDDIPSDFDVLPQ